MHRFCLFIAHSVNFVDVDGVVYPCAAVVARIKAVSCTLVFRKKRLFHRLAPAGNVGSRDAVFAPGNPVPPRRNARISSSFTTRVSL